MPNYKQIYAIQKQNEQRLLKVNPNLTDESGIYFLTRIDEDGFKYAYVGQAVKIKKRLIEHCSGYQHIDLSIKRHGFYSEDNRYGWQIDFKLYDKADLDSQEQFWIKDFANRGYQLRNKTSGSQSTGKKQIDEYRPTKNYHDGLEQGYRNASKKIAHLFKLHLNVSTKNEKPTVNQQKALDKFNEFLEYYENKK